MSGKQQPAGAHACASMFTPVNMAFEHAADNEETVPALPASVQSLQFWAYR